MIDRARAELDRKPDPARLGELVRMETELQAVCASSLEVPPCLVDVERAPLEEDVRGLGELGGLGQDLRDHEIEIRVWLLVLRRHRVRAEEVGIPPSAAIARSEASSVSRSRP